MLDATGRTTEGLRIVFMGMGEPFLNLDGVLPALEILFEILPPRRVTVSTSGITPAFAAFAALPKRPNLAVSLNAADETTRTRLMPITRTYPIPELVRAMRAWPLEPRRRILVEYVLIAGVNDREDQAWHLARLLVGARGQGQRHPVERGPDVPARLEAARRGGDRGVREDPRRRQHGRHGPAQQGAGCVRGVRAVEGADGGSEEKASKQ